MPKEARALVNFSADRTMRCHVLRPFRRLAARIVRSGERPRLGERTAPFPLAREFGNDLRAIYERLGYTMIDLPCVSVEQRADFVLHHLRVP